MSHEFETGAVAKEQAWHGLAMVVPEGAPATKSIPEFIKLAGMDWDPIEAPLWATVPGKDGVETIGIRSHKAILRDRDTAQLGLGSKDYKLVAHRQFFALAQPMLNSGLLSSIEAMASLRMGRTYYAQFRYGDPVEVQPGDPVDPFLCLASSYDGTLASRVFDTTTRVVCMNTLRASGAFRAKGEAEEVADGWAIRHQGDVDTKLAEAMDGVRRIREQFGTTVKLFRKLTMMPADLDRLREIAGKVFAHEKAGLTKKVQRLRRLQEMSADVDPQVDADIRTLEAELAKPSPSEDGVIRAYSSGPGADMATGTMWGVLNAVTYHIDHGRRGSEDGRRNSSWFGEGSRERARAMSIMGELAGAL